MWLFALLPIFMAIFGIGGIWTVFAVSVANGAVNLTKGMPYIRVAEMGFHKEVRRAAAGGFGGKCVISIGECAAHPPQSCLFAQICNIVSVLIIVIVGIRYQQAADFGYKGRANVAGFWLGFLSAVGLSVTANFQASVYFGLHFIGAFVAFTLGLPYFWIQMYLTYRAEPSVDRPWVGPVRFILCILCTISLLGMCIFNIKYESEGAACEWVAVVVFFCLFGLFAAEFRHIDCCRLTVQKPSLKSDCCPASVEINNYAV